MDGRIYQGYFPLTLCSASPAGQTQVEAPETVCLTSPLRCAHTHTLSLSHKRTQTHTHIHINMYRQLSKHPSLKHMHERTHTHTYSRGTEAAITFTQLITEAARFNQPPFELQMLLRRSEDKVFDRCRRASFSTALDLTFFSTPRPPHPPLSLSKLLHPCKDMLSSKKDLLHI